MIYLTKQTGPHDDSSGQAGTAEIEITPAMIEAGAQIVFDWFDTGEEGAYPITRTEADRLARAVLQASIAQV